MIASQLDNYQTEEKDILWIFTNMALGYTLLVLPCVHPLLHQQNHRALLLR